MPPPAPAGVPTPTPFLVDLARRVLRAAERSTGQRLRPFRLSLQAVPALEAETNTPDGLERLGLQLRDLCQTGWVTLHVDPPRPFASFLELRPRLELHDAHALAAWAGFTPRAQSWQHRWREHALAHWTAQSTGGPVHLQLLMDHLSRNPLVWLEHMDMAEATAALNALAALCQSGRPMGLREASARVFQGRSKLLDHRGELLRLLGASADQFYEPPIQLLLALPERLPDALPLLQVLFVENQTTFEHMADQRMPTWERTALVFAAGFRGSARRLRSPDGCRVYARGLPAQADLQAFQGWLAGQPEPTIAPAVHFFGDLDYAGMDILARLREMFPGAAAWVPGYEPMALALESGIGHAPEWAFKAVQTDPGATGCAYADTRLLPLMRQNNRFFDQEGLDLWPVNDAG